jgi:hypothetical protein
MAMIGWNLTVRMTSTYVTRGSGWESFPEAKSKASPKLSALLLVGSLELVLAQVSAHLGEAVPAVARFKLFPR